MGKGCAFEAKCRFPDLPRMLGNLVSNTHNAVIYVKCYRLFTFPVKVNWWEKAELDLIVRSAQQLMHMRDKQGKDLKGGGIIIGRPGCGNGGLRWVDVKQYIQGIFDDKVAVVTNVRGV